MLTFCPACPRPSLSLTRLALLATLLGFLGACAPSSDRPGGDAADDAPRVVGATRAAQPFAPWLGRVIDDRSWRVVPGPRWQTDGASADDAANAMWVLPGRAVLILDVDEALTKPLTVRLTPDDADGGAQPPTVHWNDAPTENWVTARDDGALLVRVPTDRLSTGRHVLRLSASADDPAAAITRFRAIAVGPRTAEADDGDRRWRTFLPVHAARHRFLADFLRLGVTGAFGLEKQGGIVFDGPRTLTVPLDDAAQGGGHAATRVQNASPQPMTTALRSLDDTGTVLTERVVKLEPFGRVWLDLDVPAGASALTLSADGVPRAYALWGGPVFTPKPDGDRPPAPFVLLVTLDTTRKDVLAPYGGSRRATPHLAALAAEATTFDEAYATAPWTLPSHASIFTGLYPSAHGGGVADAALGIEPPTLAEALSAHGYRTAGFAGGLLAGYNFGVARGFGRYLDPDGFETRGGPLVDAALAHLKARADDPAPQMVFVNIFDPHYPFDAPGPLTEMFDLATLIDRVDADAEPTWARVLANDSSAWAAAMDLRAEPISAAGLQALRTAYLAEVAFADARLGALLDALRAADRYDDALIIVVADHGELLGEGGYYAHSCRLDGPLIEVPLLIKWPGQRQARRHGGVVSQVDLLSTVLAAAGVPMPDAPQAPGLALTPTADTALDARPHVLFEEHLTSFHECPSNMAVARHLYGLQTPRVRQLLWDDGTRCYAPGADGWAPASCPAPDHPDRPQLPPAYRALAEAAAANDVGQLSDEDAAALRALGYLQ